MQLTLILITQNSTRWLHGFARTLAVALEESPRSSLAMVIADSGSTDDSLQQASAFWPRATLLTCGNIGYGAAANRAITRAQTDWLLLCNPDLAFDSSFFRHAAPLPIFQNPAVTAVLPQLLNPDGTLQPSIGKFPTLSSILQDQLRPRAARKYSIPQPSSAQQVDWGSAACLFLRRDLFAPHPAGIAGFDEKFFLYVEEVDLLKRAQAAGSQTWFSPELKVTHHHPNATHTPRPEIQRYAARGLLRYFAKHAAFPTLCAYRKLAFLSGRLPFKEAFASRAHILKTPTGP